jgi:hypothetical protein
MAKTATYALIEKKTLGSATSSVVFTSVPSTYTDLILEFSGSTSSGNLMRIRFNGDTGSNYSVTMMWGSSSGAVASAYSESWIWVIPNAGNAMQNAQIHLQDYSNTTTFKNYLSRANQPTDSVTAAVGLWRNTAAITSITLSTSSDNFTAGSTFTLYGIQAGNA